MNIHNDVFKSLINEKSILENIYENASHNVFRIEKIELNLNESVLILGDGHNINEKRVIVEFCKLYSIQIAYTLGSKNTQALIPNELFYGVYGYAGNDSAINLI